MPIRINLKELFPSDAQDLTVDKINFNFNKLLELGIGEIGLRGYSGIQGSAGPDGITGPDGDRGSTWFVDPSNDPNSVTFIDLQAGDLYLDSTNFAVWQYDGTSWNFKFDLTTIINTYLAASPSPFVRGLGNGSPVDDRFIMFNNRSSIFDNSLPGMGFPDSGTNDVLFLNNFDEKTVDWNIPELNLTSPSYNALLKIFTQEPYSSDTEVGRVHLEMGMLYAPDPVGAPGVYALTDIIDNFKMGFTRISGIPAVPTLDHYNLSIFSMDKPLTGIYSARKTNGLFEFRFPKVAAVGLPNEVKESASIFIGSRYGIDQLCNTSNISAIDGITFKSEINGVYAAIGVASLYNITTLPYETGYITNALDAQSYFMLDTLAGDIHGIHINKKLLQDGGNIIQVGTTAPRITKTPTNTYGSPFNFRGHSGIASVGNTVYVVSGDPSLGGGSAGAEYYTRYGYLNRYTIENPNNPVLDKFTNIQHRFNGQTAMLSASINCAANDAYTANQSSLPVGIGMSDIDIVGKYAYITNTQITYDSANIYTISGSDHERTVFQILELDKFSQIAPARVSRLGYPNGGNPLVLSAQFYLNAAYRVKVKGKYAIVGTNALYGPNTSRSYLGMPAGTTVFDPRWYFGHLQLVDISNPASPITSPTGGAVATPTTLPAAINDIGAGRLAQAIMDFEIIDDHVVTLTWEQGLDNTLFGGNHPTSVHMDVFNTADLSTDSGVISYRGRSDNPLLNILPPDDVTYANYIKYGAITANKKYIYAAYGKTVKVFAFDNQTTTGTNITGCKYTYNQLISFTVPIVGFGASFTWGIYDIKQLGNSLYILAIGYTATPSFSTSYVFKYDVSGGLSDPIANIGNVDGNGDTIPVWTKALDDYQIATRLKIIGKHIYAAASGASTATGFADDTDTVQLIPLDFDGIYTAGAHIESLRMDAGYVTGDLEVGQTLTVQNDVQVAGSLNVINSLHVGDNILVENDLQVGGDVSVDGSISIQNDLTVTGVISGIGATPIGATIPYAGLTAPPGWRLCDGSQLNRTIYLPLFNVIGTTYGTSSPTTFNLPNLQQRIPLGLDLSTSPTPISSPAVNELNYGALGNVGGNNSIATPSTLAPHSHEYDAYSWGQGSSHVWINQKVNPAGSGSKLNFTKDDSNETDVSGTSQSLMDNRMKYLVLNYIIYVAQ